MKNLFNDEIRADMEGLLYSTVKVKECSHKKECKTKNQKRTTQDVGQEDNI